MASDGLNDDSSIAGEVDFLATCYPPVIKGESRAVVADAGGSIRRSPGDGDDRSNQPKTRRAAGSAFPGLSTCIAAVLVQRTTGEQHEKDGHAQLILRLRFHLALGVECERLRGVRAGQGCFNILRFAAGKRELAKAEVQNSSTTEVASRFCP